MNPEVTDLRPPSLTRVFGAVNVPFTVTCFDMLCFIFVHFEILHNFCFTLFFDR